MMKLKTILVAGAFLGGIATLPGCSNPEPAAETLKEAGNAALEGLDKVDMSKVKTECDCGSKDSED